VSYRYARFSGDDPDSDEDEGYDPLFYSSSDWGLWDQGEILGEYVVENSNLKTHTVRLALHPTKRVTVSLLYYYFLIDEPRAAGVDSDQLARELDLILDYELNENVSFILVGAAAHPEEGGEEFAGGDDWYYGMVYTRFAF
jgi:hypothetical protein